jgi:acetoin utilization deacetylase AcuC-like enzyme
MRKLPVVAAAVKAGGLAELIDPGSIDHTKLMRLHDPDYVISFLNGSGRLAASQGWGWTEQIRAGVLAINAGQLRAAELALEHGVAANIAQGFHHAVYSRGNAFCTFNGLALVAQEFPHLKVGVLDCDQHQGNGTSEFTTKLLNLFNYTIYGTTFGAEETVRSINRPLRSCANSFDSYLSAVDDGLKQMQEWEVDLIQYQASADPHFDDPYGTLGLSSDDLRTRDRFVFESARKKGISVLFVLAGGYQEPIETALVPLHVATFEEAFRVYANSPNLENVAPPFMICDVADFCQ